MIMIKTTLPVTVLTEATSIKQPTRTLNHLFYCHILSLDIVVLYMTSHTPNMWPHKYRSV